jgi:hypothetical protein
MNFGRVISMFDRDAPKISRGIGQVADVGRNIGQDIQHNQYICSSSNQISGGHISVTYSP